MNVVQALGANLVRASVVLFASMASLEAEDPAVEIKALREEIRLLDRRLHELEQKQQIPEHPTADLVPNEPKGKMRDRGFSSVPTEGANVLRIHGLVQFDSRWYFADHGATNDTFVLRRARLIAEGTFDQIYSFQLMPEFGGTGPASILDASLGIAVSPAVQFKFGKFKVPIGLELLQSDTWTFFDERSLVSNLVPNRDLGIQIGGGIRNGTITYAAGVFNGVSDGGSSTNADYDNNKNLVARIYLRPFKNEKGSLWQGLALGAAGNVGREKTASALANGYKSDGQQTFFKYRSGVTADGRNWRLAPQAEYRCGPLGVLSEYVVSTVNARPSATGPKAELQNRAWQLAAGWVITGEESSYNGIVPKAAFTPIAGTWGAFEVTARYANLKVDNAAFPQFADLASYAQEASAFGLGLNWYLSKTVRFTADYYHTRFGFDPAAPAVSNTPALQQDEQALITRLQVAF